MRKCNKLILITWAFVGLHTVDETLIEIFMVLWSMLCPVNHWSIRVLRPVEGNIIVEGFKEFVYSNTRQI